MKIESLKELIKAKNFGKAAEKSAEWLIKHDYVYSPVFGWERAEIVERFNLDPNKEGVPMQLKPKIIEIKATGKDRYGNTVQGAEGSTTWGTHETEKEWYVADNYLEYMKFKKARDTADIFMSGVTESLKIN
jgi:hypothetical protein